MKQLLILTALFVFSGCQQTRSFFHMNSNSPSPFMGLELSVDAGDSQNEDGLRKSSDNDLTVTPVMLTQVSEHNRSLKDDADGKTLYSLPAVELGSNATEAAEVDDIMARIAGS